VGDHPSGPDRPQRIAGANHEHHPVDQDPP
jgi:hypothetical protein